MSWTGTASEFQEQLDDALDHHRHEQVVGLVEQIDPSRFDPTEAQRVVCSLRRKRKFDELIRAVPLFVMGGPDSASLKRHYAQALIEKDQLEAALATLQKGLPMVDDDPDEGPEFRGLIGRAFKQRFVKERNAEDLKQAINAYRIDWERSQASWNGINLVALVERAKRDGIELGMDVDTREVASQILGKIGAARAAGTIPVWDTATAMEAAVALGDEDRALGWLKRYAPSMQTDASERADAFELGATLRQLRQIWQLDGAALGQKLIPVLEFELLQCEGGTLQPSMQSADPDGFESVYGAEGHTNLQWLDTMMATCRGVARVQETASGRACGTGFLARGEDLRPAWSGRLVLVTNSHVVSPDAVDEAPLKPGEGSAEFTRLEGRPRVELGRLLFTSPRRNLDVTVCEIEPPGGVDPIKITEYRPDLGAEIQRIYVVGHPQGRELAISLYDNALVDYQDPYVRYKSPTEEGHSGSPALNRQCHAFAIHHAARGSLEVNEGVLFKAILEAVTRSSPK